MTSPAKTSRIIVVPTANLARLVCRAVRSGRLPYNYAVGFKDVRGFGLSLANAAWLQPGQTYVNPHSYY